MKFNPISLIKGLYTSNPTNFIISSIAVSSLVFISGIAVTSTIATKLVAKEVHSGTHLTLSKIVDDTAAAIESAVTSSGSTSKPGTPGGSGSHTATTSGSSTTASTAPGGTSTSTPTSTSTATPTPTPTPTPTMTGSLYPPKAGTIFWGFHEGPTTPLQDSGVTPGINRGYFDSYDKWPQMIDYAKNAVAHGSLPFVSIKPPGSWQAISQGQYDSWVRQIINGLTAINAPVLWTIHHEPENDVNGTTMTAATFKAMDEHVTAMHNTATSKVRFGPVLMEGKYNPVSTPNQSIRLNVTDWVSPSSGHFFAFDGYNHYDPNNGLPWRSVNDVFNWMVNGGVYGNQPRIIGFRDVDPSKPIVIAEFGVRDYSGDPTRAPQWLDDAYAYGINNHIAAMAYFSSGQNVHDGGGPWTLQGARLTEWLKLLHKSSSVYLK